MKVKENEEGGKTQNRRAKGEGLTYMKDCLILADLKRKSRVKGARDVGLVELDKEVKILEGELEERWKSWVG